MATRRRSGRPPKRVVNPVFYIPEGLDDLEYEVIDADDAYDDEDESGGATGGEKKDDGEDKGGGKGIPGTPQIIKIVEQKLRTRGDGSQVVDIIVLITKKTKADTYKFKLTKTNSGKSNRYIVDEDGKVAKKVPN